ncbi:flagellar basal body-associated FliL family protein [Jeotgalibaca dankookensis]|uniref:flagellar basal body-associated FliL family protein n=1 Tax=Jeotgalibaca dankookensis TaxID=708126 RepID=UPI0007830205|nr:flagellar basal body-associated FliL family protein [Jeotgalibaca dankookensis]
MKNKVEKTNLPSFKKKIIAVIVAIFIIGGSAISFFIFSDQAKAFFESTQEEKKEQIMVPYSEFLINLKPSLTADKRFLRIELSFEVSSIDSEAVLVSQEAMIRDTIISLLRKQTSETIFSEVDGNLSIKQEIKDELNQILGETIVEHVYVTDMVMQ